MQSESSQSQRFPAEWSGARAVLEKWLRRRCVSEGWMNLFGGSLFLILGAIALVFTSCILAGITLMSLLGLAGLADALGIHVSMFRPLLFTILFIFFFMLSVVHAYRTRWERDSTAHVDFDDSGSTLRSLWFEFISAGPIFFVLAVQDLWRFVRLSRMDGPQVSALLLWLYDKGGRAGFMEIALEFPGLNAVRVLPQLRDIPGINWWPSDAEISISETLQWTFEQLLGRKPKSPSPYFHSYAHEHRHAGQPVPEVDNEIAGWYATLDLPVFASLQEVKARYRKLAKIYHPDARRSRSAPSFGSDDDQMKRINEAYHNILKKSESKAGFAP